MLKIPFLLLLLLSCIGYNQNNVPDWYIHNQENTQSHLYGCGSANNKEQAIHEALSNLKERIYTSISSNTFIHDTSINGKSKNEYSRTIHTTNSSINIPNYNIEQIELTKDTYYVIASATRQSLANNVLENIHKEISEISSLFTNYRSTQNQVYKVKIINTLKQKCDSHTETERFYNGLGYMLPNRICPEIYKIHYNFKIENNLEIANTHPLIQEMLINIFSQKFTVVQEGDNVITYKTDVQNKKIDNTFISGVTINIVQHNSSEVYKKNCLGSSTESSKKATENAFKICLSQSRNMIFEEFFNLK